MNSLFRIVIYAFLTFSTISLKAMSEKENKENNLDPKNSPVIQRLQYISTIRAYDYEPELRMNEFKVQTENMNNGSCKAHVMAHAEKRKALNRTQSLPVMNNKTNLPQPTKLTKKIKEVSSTTKSWEELTAEQTKLTRTISIPVEAGK